MFKFFISYSSEDIINVNLLKKQIEESASGIEVFVGEKDIRPTENYLNRISLEIKQCDLFILFWSKNSKQSDWVNQEIGHAYALNKTILPIIFEANLELSGFISNIQGSKFFTNDPTAENRIDLFIKELVNNKLGKERQQKDRDQVQKTVFSVIIGGLLLKAISSS